MKIQAIARTECGEHAVNEDAFAFGPHPLDPNHQLGAIADGQGGQAGGAAAARLACDEVLACASRMPPRQLAKPATWRSLLRSVDQAVRNHPNAGYTTLVAFCLSEAHLWGASSGDSAAVMANANQPCRILTSGQAKNPPVGSSMANFACFDSTLVAPWTVLAMTDGVWKYAGWETIYQTIAHLSGRGIIDAIADHARLRRSGRFQDDFTMLLFHSDKD